MAKIDRFGGDLKAFASESLGTERTVFGDTIQADDLTSQLTAAFLRGWGIVGPSDSPTIQDFNALGYAHGQLLAYLHQMGVAEFNGLQEYFIGSVAVYGGRIYQSLTTPNIGNIPDVSPSNWVAVTGASPIIASSRNIKANLSAAAASISFTADEIVVKKAIGGQSFGLASFSQTLNTATVGAGGMDIGLAPVSGFVSIYAIYNPSSNARALLACDQTVSNGPTYTGANMPAGYTASALISAWGTNASRLLNIGAQIENEICVPLATLFSTTSIFSFAPTNIAAFVPIATKEIAGLFQSGAASVNANSTVGMASTSSGTGRRSSGGTSPVSGAVYQSSYSGLKIFTPQTVYISTDVTFGALEQAAAYLTAYKI